MRVVSITRDAPFPLDKAMRGASNSGSDIPTKPKRPLAVSLIAPDYGAQDFMNIKKIIGTQLHRSHRPAPPIAGGTGQPATLSRHDLQRLVAEMLG